MAGLVLVTTAAAIEVTPRLLHGLEHEWERWPGRFERLAYSPEMPADVRHRSAALAAGAGKEQTLADFRACGTLDLRERLGEVACPTLVVVGEHDQMIPPLHGEALAAGIPGATLARGHVPMHEQPDAFVATLAAFLAPLG